VTPHDRAADRGDRRQPGERCNRSGEPRTSVHFLILL
jgi:hypothetical protein